MAGLKHFANYVFIYSRADQIDQFQLHDHLHYHIGHSDYDYYIGDYGLEF